MLQIRKANLEDIDTLIKVSIQVFFETYAKDNDEADLQTYLSTKFTEEKLKGEFNEPDVTFFIAEYDNQVVGYAKLRNVMVPGELFGRSSLEIELLYVLKEFHSKKIGKELMETSINEAKKTDFEVLWLGVSGNNTKAFEFFKRWGFEQFDEIIFQSGEYKQTDYFMKLELKSVV